MIKFAILRLVLFGAAVAALIMVWDYDAALVNRWFDRADTLVSHLAVALARYFQMNESFVRQTLKMFFHLERSIVIFVLMLVIFAIMAPFWEGLAALVRGRPSFGWILRALVRALVVMVVAHVSVAIAVIKYPDIFEKVVGWHEQALRSMLVFFGWHRADTVLTRVLHLQNTLIVAETAFVIATLLSLVGRVVRLLGRHTATAATTRQGDSTMQIHIPGTPRTGGGLWLLMLVGAMSSVLIAAGVGVLTLMPQKIGAGMMVLAHDFWPYICGWYLFLQVLVIVSRPINKEAWEIFDIFTSFLPIGVVLLVIPSFGLYNSYNGGVFWPTDYWAMRIWTMSWAFAATDFLLIIVAYKISRAAQRITGV